MIIKLLTISPIYTQDWILFALYAVIIIILATWFAKRNASDFLIRKYFVKGIVLKIIGSLGFAFFHIFVQKYGDTFSYHEAATTLREVFQISQSDFFEILFSSTEKSKILLDNYLFEHDHVLRSYESNFAVIRLDTFLSPITQGFYLPTCLFFSIISYWGIWQAFRSMCMVFSMNDKNLALAFLYFPTVVFWGSGVMKDTICIGSLCLLLSCTLNMLYFSKRLILNSILCYLLLIILLNVKSYIAIAYLPSLAILVYAALMGKVKILPLRVGLTAIVIIVLVISLPTITERLNEIILKQAEELVADIVKLNGNLQANAASAFDIGISPENITQAEDLLNYFPAALNVSFFRPYLWESKSVAMLISAIESTLFFCFTIFIFLRGYLIRPLGRIFKHKVLLTNFIFSILFGGLVGLSTSNFGTVVRYKMPCMPLILSVLLIVNKSRGTYVFDPQIKKESNSL
jgi:hypothetical protein